MLGHQLPHQRPAAGAQGGADNHLVPPRRVPRQEKTGHVRTRDQQDHHDRGEQQQQCRPQVASACLRQRHDPRPDATIDGIPLGQLGGDALDVSVCRRNGNAALQQPQCIAAAVTVVQRTPLLIG